MYIYFTGWWVGGVAEQIKIAFKQRISEKDWLDRDTKERSKKKVFCMGTIIKQTEMAINH